MERVRECIDPTNQTLSALQSLQLSAGLGPGQSMTTPVETSLGSPYLSYKYSIMYDTITPGFVSRQKRGEIISNPMSREEIQAISTDVDFTADSSYTDLYSPPGSYWGANTYRLRTCRDARTLPTLFVGRTPDSLDGDVEDAMNDTLLSARTNANNSPFMGAVTLAEAGQTYQLLATLTTRLTDMTSKDFWSALRDGNLRTAHLKKQLRALRSVTAPLNATQLNARLASAKLLRQRIRRVETLAASWLTYRYGIRQLLLDIQAGTEAIKRLNKRQRVRFTSHRFLNAPHQTWSGEASTIVDGPHGRLQVLTNTNLNFTESAVVRSGVLIAPRLSGWAIAGDAFGASQILTTALDLTRLSFVLGWVLNTNKLAASANLSLTKEVLASWTVVKRNKSYFVIDNYSVLPPLTIGEYWNTPRSWATIQGPTTLSGETNGEASYTLKTTSRNVNPVVDYWPALDVRIGISQGIDLAALSVQLTKAMRR